MFSMWFIVLIECMSVGVDLYSVCSCWWLCFSFRVVWWCLVMFWKVFIRWVGILFC